MGLKVIEGAAVDRTGKETGGLSMRTQIRHMHRGEGVSMTGKKYQSIYGSYLDTPDLNSN